ncbi:Mammalian cell entry protein [Candidatus Nitrotoga sp. HW29]|uniref:MlaD family protein n=1 Tax=Candidatus Nitrotoga sp. HW29 TaxID=2886963 RepID=UPI001EF1D2AA|nr:MlaD family protein [Candidatus Nitrotoga sp. HW29]CAH1903655.1 Mammalian cell entry protein [Candidatus Nitrotoga sp. HW29]
MTSHFKLGLFIIIGFGILCVMVIALGARTLFQSAVVFETYINGSVQGLEVGSAVKYRGVVIGKVSKITFTYTVYEQEKPLDARKPYVMILAKVRPELIGVETVSNEQLQTQIDRGLRMRLASVGITGTSFLELDYVKPKNNPHLLIDWKPQNYYVPSAEGLVAQISSAAEAFAQRLEHIDIEAVLTNINSFTATAQRKLDELPIERLSSEGLMLMREMGITNSKLQATIVGLNDIVGDPAWKVTLKHTGSASSDVAAAAARIRKITESGQIENVLARVNRLAQRADRLVAGEEDDIASIVGNMRRASENLQLLSEDLKRNPSRLLRSAPPPEIKRP